MKSQSTLTNTCNGTVITVYPPSVIGTPTHQAKVVCTNSGLHQNELNHLRRALGKCNYPSWAIKRVQHKVLNNNWEDKSHNNSTNNNTGNNNGNTYNNNQGSNPTNNKQSNKATGGQILIPYTKGKAKSIKNKHVVSIVYRYTLKVTQQSNKSSWNPRTGIPRTVKVD